MPNPGNIMKRKGQGYTNSNTKKKNVQSHPHAPTPKKKRKKSLGTQQANTAASSTQSSTDLTFPLSYPHSSKLPIPKSSFLRDIEGYKASFQTALDTSYLGFEIDKYDKQKQNQVCDHNLVEKALLTMDKHGLFRTDVTQPFGLGTKCAKTYVTRCLLGEEGSTYKYLGLRMFAYPWGKYHEGDSQSNSMELEKALTVISLLNEKLTDRTTVHLNSLSNKRRETLSLPKHLNQKMIKGRAKYDVALINRMVDTKDLKQEPSMGDGGFRCSVSWHADSSLEHFSSIAVYHTILNENKVNSFIHGSENMKESNFIEGVSSDRWSIALRVAHNSEGPGASRRGTDIESSVVTNSPPIAVSLPSRSAYYLLDDFNHHHQHAVLLNEADKQHSSAGVRYASTHRLLREGHNIHFILLRCKTVCSQFHKKGPKIWRSEQLLLTEIESEWIRQFFIQGEGHKSKLWKYWKEPIRQLLVYWSRLEQRTKQVIDVLGCAARERCRIRDGENNDISMKRKERDKQKKSLVTIDEILNRGKDNDPDMNSAFNLIYSPMSMMIEERANMRMLWEERENDRVFKYMSIEYKPIPVPLRYNIIGGSNTSKMTQTVDIYGESPLAGSHEELKRISEELKQYGHAFMSRNSVDLPAMEKSSPSTISTTKDVIFEKKKLAKEKGELTESTIQVTSKNIVDKIQNAVVPQSNLDSAEHTKSMDWIGWKKHPMFGLEMQLPWSQHILNGKKTIETRSYDLPKALIGKKIFILESKSGEDGVSSLGNNLVGDEINDNVIIAGWVIFDKVILYRYRSKFEDDEKKHLVRKDSAYGWRENDTTIIYGWSVKNKGKLQNNKKPCIRSMTRRMRSLFSLEIVKPG